MNVPTCEQKLVRILIDHPPFLPRVGCSCQGFGAGFYHLESRIRLDRHETTKFFLCLHESQFERVP